MMCWARVDGSLLETFRGSKYPIHRGLKLHSDQKRCGETWGEALFLPLPPPRGESPVLTWNEPAKPVGEATTNSKSKESAGAEGFGGWRTGGGGEGKPRQL